jgi:hypothetical protein
MTAKKVGKRAPKKKATKRESAKRKTVAKKRPTTKKTGRPRTAKAKLDVGLAAFGKGKSVEDAAKEAGVGKRTLERELTRLNIQTTEVDESGLPAIDWDAPSVEVARQGLNHAIQALPAMGSAHRSFAVQQGVVQRRLDRVRQWAREEAVFRPSVAVPIAFR